MEEDQVAVKTSQASIDVEQQKKDAALQGDMNSYFNERGKNDRGIDGKIEDAVQMSAAEAEVKEMLYEVSMKDNPLPEGIEPMSNSIFLTARRNKIRTESGLVLTSAMMGDSEVDYKEIQTVLAHGPHVQQAFTGSEVCINFERLRMRPSGKLAEQASESTPVIVVPIVTINEADYIELSERDLKYILKKSPNPNEIQKESCK